MVRPSAFFCWTPFHRLFTEMSVTPPATHIRSDSNHFKEAVFDEIGFLDSDKIREEVVGIAKELTAGHPAVRSILLECSMLPPYGKDVQQAVNLPVYDYLTMIDFVYSSLVKKRFDDAI